MIFRARIFIILWLAALLPFEIAVAQSGDSGNKEVESLYDSFDRVEKRKSDRRKPRRKRFRDKEITKLSELAELAPFYDVAIINRKFLPKTKRFELTSLGVVGINNAFFNTYGLNLTAGYYFHEKHGFEVNYILFTDSERDVTADLKKRRKISTRSLVVPENYMGLAYKWVPVYGKMSWLNKRIVPFDIYFAPGFGMTSTKEGSSPTLHMAAGQFFAMSKSWAVRWDLSWNYYQADVIQDDGSGSDKKDTKNHSDIFLSIGASFFFPEASYR